MAAEVMGDAALRARVIPCSLDTEGSHRALSHSLDHEVARRINQGSKSPLILSVGTAFNNVKGVLSYAAAQEPYAPETNPRNVYNGLTGLFSSDGGGGEADHRVKRGESIIDLVSEDLATFKRLDMSQADQERIDDWLQLLRA